jgi:hypothetical protein
MKGLLVAIAIMLPGIALADDWGCEVLLCLANPQGPTAVAECRPPIQKLWRHLARGRAFPTCTFVDTQGNARPNNSGSYATHQFASAPGNCPDVYVDYEPESGNARCRLSGAISVVIDNRLDRKVWWGLSPYAYESEESTVTETYAAPGASSNLDLAWQAELARRAAEQPQN